MRHVEWRQMQREREFSYFIFLVVVKQAKKNTFGIFSIIVMKWRNARELETYFTL